MLTDLQFKTTSMGVVAELYPYLDDDWSSMVDVETGVGEWFVALDDALQGAALGQVCVTDDLARRVQLIIDNLPENDSDRERLGGWLARLPRKQDSAA